MKILYSIALIVLSSGVVSGQISSLNQGWDQKQKESFYFTPQGSHLIPYQWFLTIEQADCEELFRNNNNLKSYGFLPTKKSNLNPDGLPIGLVADTDEGFDWKLKDKSSNEQFSKKVLQRFHIKKSYIGKNFDREAAPKAGRRWFGFTCAACHTHEIEFEGTTFRIDGGSTNADTEKFLRDLGLAMSKNLDDPDKFDRLAKRLKRTDGKNFKKEFKQISDAVNSLVELNKSKHRYGNGRLDAFGAILNSVCKTGLNIPCNRRPSNAPVSFPTLWNITKMGYVQWPANAPFAEARNVGEVLGVFGCFSLEGPNRFNSTIKLKNLVKLEHELLAKLRSPAWPEEILGKIDFGKAKRGQVLFRKNCQSCHSERQMDGKFRLNDAGRIPIVATPISELKTDAQFLKNISPADQVLTGSVSDLLNGRKKASRIEILQAVVKQILGKRAFIEKVDLFGLMPKPQNPSMPPGGGYISRPLDGIWASPPYLHNGSVPNLYQLLLPSKHDDPKQQRIKSFWVGSRKFDPRQVGYRNEKTKHGFLFRVVDQDGKVIPGNDNAGHEGHGNAINRGFTQTFENGKWRDFTEKERFELVEYMKTLSHPDSWEKRK